jgi:hypothetical protein
MDVLQGRLERLVKKIENSRRLSVSVLKVRNSLLCDNEILLPPTPPAVKLLTLLIMAFDA